MQLRQLIKSGEEALSRLYSDREAYEIVLLLLETLIGTKRYTHVSEPDYLVDDDSASKVFSAFERLANGEPVQYVLGQAWFFGRCFKVSGDVLIPRPETEILCDMCIGKMNERGLGRGARVIDLCTGSGCIAWTVALEKPGAKVWAGDISTGALELASSQDFSEELNKKGASSPVFFATDILKDDIFRDITEDSGRQELVSCAAIPTFDVVLSNPPYVKDSEKAQMRKNVLDFEPSLALFVPDSDPLRFYKALARHSSALLSPSGFGIVEINEALGVQTASLFSDAGFRQVEVVKDFSGRDRFVYFSR